MFITDNNNGQTSPTCLKKQAGKLSDQNWRRWETFSCFWVNAFGPFAPICQIFLWRFVSQPVFSWLNTCVCVDAKLKGEWPVKEKTSIFVVAVEECSKICHFSCQSKLALWSLQESVSSFRCRIIYIIAHEAEAFMTKHQLTIGIGMFQIRGISFFFLLYFTLVCSGEIVLCLFGVVNSMFLILWIN